MRKHPAVLPTALCALLLAFAAAPAGATPRSGGVLSPGGPGAAGGAAVGAATLVQPAAFRGGGRRSFGSRPRSGYQRNRYRARPRLHPGGIFRGILQALGIAYLFHMLFGWGGGGSPLGLLLLLAISFWIFSRMRRRAAHQQW